MPNAETLRAALANLLKHAERANEIMLHEAGIGVCDVTAIAAARAALDQQPAPVLLQGGLDNDALRAAWDKKLPGVAPTDCELSAFALGVEVGFEHARNLERQDWSRVHHVLAKHGKHPGRTDDHLADVIDRALSAT